MRALPWNSHSAPADPNSPEAGRSRVAVGLVLGVALTGAVLAGCGDSEGDSAEGSRGESYDDVAALATAVEQIGETCTLEYDELSDEMREFSACQIGENTIQLSVWNDPEDADALLGFNEGNLVGPNWSIQVDDPDLATQIQDAIEGEMTGSSMDSPDEESE